MQKAFSLITTLLIALTSTSWAAAPATSPAKPARQTLEQSMAKLQRLSDEDALRNLAYSYARGNDAISIQHGDRDKARKQGFVEYARGMASDIKIEVYALGSDSPFNTTTGIPAWVEFVDKYFETQRYTSTVHLMSNFSIDFIDADNATVSSYATVPHFIMNSAKDKANADATVEFMNCRYKFDARRQKDGTWKTVKLRIELQEIWRGIGFYPGGQGKGM